MAYKDTTYTKTIKDFYDSNSSKWTQGVLTVKVKANGKIDYSIVMTHDTQTDGNGVSIYLKIGSKLIYDTYTSYGNNSTDSRWKTWPTGNNVSKTEKDVTSTTGKTVSVVFGICCMQSCREADGLQGRWNNKKNSDGSINYSGSTGKRYTATITRQEEEVKETVQWTNVTASAPTITDNGNNTYSISASAGTAGTNNAVKSTTLYYKVGSASYSTASGLSASGSVTSASTVSAYTKVTGTYNNANSTTTSKSIAYYAAPGAPGKPVISYSKSQLTTQEEWTFNWTAGTAANSSSPIKGYHIKFYVNGTAKKGLYFLLNGTALHIKLLGLNDSVTRESTSTKLTLNPDATLEDFGIKDGDKIKLSVSAYTENGAGTKLSSSWVTSAEYQIKNSSIVHVKTATGWQEGTVYVKTATGWQQAQSINVKTATGWQEAN